MFSYLQFVTLITSNGGWSNVRTLVLQALGI